MRSARFVVYEDKAGEWRWRLVGANNRTMADSAESFTRPRDAGRSVDTVANAILGIHFEAPEE